MPIKFEVKMTEEYMHDFLLYHTYTHMSGIVEIIAGILGLVTGIKYLLSGNSQAGMIGLLIAAMFLIINPMSMKSKARNQVKQTEMFQKPLEYELDETGITVRQGELATTNKWEDFTKAISTKKSVIVYVTKVRAIILPKEYMEEQYDEVLEMIRAHMPASKVKIKNVQ